MYNQKLSGLAAFNLLLSLFRADYCCVSLANDLIFYVFHNIIQKGVPLQSARRIKIQNVINKLFIVFFCAPGCHKTSVKVKGVYNIKRLVVCLHVFLQACYKPEHWQKVLFYATGKGSLDAEFNNFNLVFTHGDKITFHFVAVVTVPADNLNLVALLHQEPCRLFHRRVRRNNM